MLKTVSQSRRTIIYYLPWKIFLFCLCPGPLQTSSNPHGPQSLQICFLNIINQIFFEDYEFITVCLLCIVSPIMKYCKFSICLTSEYHPILDHFCIHSCSLKNCLQVTKRSKFYVCILSEYNVHFA